ncbi:MAG: CSLREA domain-containing protein [Wenzhouxiangellaceae bacterium]
MLTVNSVGDAPDFLINGSCDTGATIAGGAAECSLRAAIQEANATPEFDEIRFDIPGCPGGICVIDIVTAGGNFLPDLIAPVSIDGSTQPGNAGVCDTPIPDRPAYRVVLDNERDCTQMKIQVV